MYISKKDLLAMTGISYGQLYRWKRERLIPEEWFIKQSSYTGQETFFPREQILSRVRSILELKDTYSLEEVAKMLSPEVGKTVYTKEQIEDMEEVDAQILNLFMNEVHKDNLSFTEIITIVVWSDLKKKYSLAEKELIELLKETIAGIRKLNKIGITFILMTCQDSCYVLLSNEEAQLHIDQRMEVRETISFSQISNQLKIKYQGRFK